MSKREYGHRQHRQGGLIQPRAFSLDLWRKWLQFGTPTYCEKRPD